MSDRGDDVDYSAKSSAVRLLGKDNQSGQRLVGTIRVRNQGRYGWIEHAQSTHDYYVRGSDLGTALPGDQVFFRIVKPSINVLRTSTTGLKPHAKVIGIAKRQPRNIVVLVNHGQTRIFNLELQCYQVKIVKSVVTNGFYYSCVLETVVNRCLLVRIKSKISSWKEPQAPTAAVLQQFGVLTFFGPDVARELKQFSLSIKTDPTIQQQKRVDLTNQILVTIDGATAQDFDDAIGVEVLLNGDFKLMVAIADVAHYVRPGSALDQAAMLRGCSIYLPSRTLPMLPTRLSDDLCSLRPATDRLAVVCEIRVNQSAEIIATRFYRAIINSRARLTYEQVDLWLAAGRSLSDPKLNVMLKHAQQLANLLQKKYEVAGYISLNLTQQHLELDQDHCVVNIKANEQISLSRKMIEIFMITANQQVALFIQRKFKFNLLFRNHLPITADKLAKVIRSSKIVLPKLQTTPTKKTPLYRTIQTIVDQLAQQPHTKRLIDYLVVHNLERAFYQEVNQKHFGLGMGTYTHFTSPIRRYPDLMVHRLLELYFNGQTQPLVDPQAHHRIIERCNLNESKQTKCEQVVRKINIIKYMQQYQNRIFRALIKQVYRWGMRVELDNLVQGEVSVRAMNNDYYQFEPERELLIGRHTHQTYQIGQFVSVKLMVADDWSRKIEFALVS